MADEGHGGQICISNGCSEERGRGGRGEKRGTKEVGGGKEENGGGGEGKGKEKRERVEEVVGERGDVAFFLFCLLNVDVCIFFLSIYVLS